MKKGVKWGVKKGVKWDNTFCNSVVDKRIVHFNFHFNFYFYFHFYFSLLYVIFLLSLIWVCFFATGFFLPHHISRLVWIRLIENVISLASVHLFARETYSHSTNYSANSKIMCIFAV